MKEIKVSIIEAFAKQVKMGNPAGVIFDADSLTESQMQNIAKIVGFNESVFILKSAVADMKLRYFTPNHEMNLCGHATIASISEFMKKNHIKESKSLTVETLAGIININYNADLHEVTMTQSPAKFKTFNGDLVELMSSIGLSIDDLDKNYPVIYGNTGIWTILIPIKKLESFERMKPVNEKFSDILKEIPTASVHPFSLETIYSYNDMHGRHFSASHSGTIEDPVTGTASGVMGAYYITYIKDVRNVELMIEQGQEMGRDGQVKVCASKMNDGEIEVEISGTSVFVEEINLTIK